MHPPIPQAILEFFQAYRDAFNALDGAAVAQLYADHSGIAQNGAYFPWPSRAPVIENMSQLCKQYSEKGFLRADFEPCAFIEQGKHHAIMDVQWQISWSGTQKPWIFQTTYNLICTTGSWQILLCTAYSEPTVAA